MFVWHRFPRFATAIVSLAILLSCPGIASSAETVDGPESADLIPALEGHLGPDCAESFGSSVCLRVRRPWCARLHLLSSKRTFL